MLELTEQQRQAAETGEPPIVIDSQTQKPYVLLSKAVFDRLRELMEDEKEKEGWAMLARRAATEWAKENP